MIHHPPPPVLPPHFPCVHPSPLPQVGVDSLLSALGTDGDSRNLSKRLKAGGKEELEVRSSPQSPPPPLTPSTSHPPPGAPGEAGCGPGGQGGGLRGREERDLCVGRGGAQQAGRRPGPHLHPLPSPRLLPILSLFLLLFSLFLHSTPALSPLFL